MTMAFPYFDVHKAQPIYPLHGRSVRPRPIISVALFGPSGSVPLDALLDTGADDTVFHEDIAPLIGVDLTNAPIGTAGGMGSGETVIRYATVRLRIADNQEKREWTAIVGFAALGKRRAVLGFAGCLEYFTATFHGDREVVELAINKLYTGT